MANTCTICRHKKRAEIEAEITAGEPLRRIATRYGSTEATIRRHKSCIIEVVQDAVVRRDLGTVATVKEVLAVLSEQMRFDTTDLFDKQGKIDVLDLRRRGLGRMLKSVSYREDGTINKVETHGQQSAAIAILNAYTRIEIAKYLTDARILSDRERAERIAALLNRARERRA